jgi:hypothetical protein
VLRPLSSRLVLAAKARPRLLTALVAVGVFVALRLLLSLTTHELTVARVTASGTAGPPGRYAPEKVVDGCTIEAASLYNHWLLPERTAGWIRLDLGGAYELDEIALLNTRNGLGADRRTRRYHLELVDAKAPEPIAGVLPPYPRWQHHPLASTATAVIVHIDDFEGVGGGLDEVTLVGRPAGGPGRYRDTILAVLLTATLVTLWRWSPGRLRAALTRERLWLLGLGLALAVIGYRLLRFSNSVSVFEWGLVYQASEFDTWAKTRTFFAELRMPLPPLLALLEIVSYRLTGTSDFVIRTLYRASMVGGYLGALALAYPSVRRMVLTFVVSHVFLASTMFIHPGNPQVYDVVYPFLIVSFLVLLRAALRARSGARAQLVLLGLAGLVLSVVGLTRPFAIFLVPIVSLLVVRRLGLKRRREVATFLAGVALLALPWHLHLLVSHGQPTMSNHTGFNLHNAWPMAPMPGLIPEDRKPPNRWFNNPQHIVNSRRIQSAIGGWIAAHPWLAVRNVLRRVDAMLEGKTVVLPSRLQPDDDVLLAYQPLVRLLMLLALIGAGVRIARWRRGGDTVGACLLVLTVGSLLLLAIGDAGEEARFVISLLPMLAVVPGLRVEHDLEEVPPTLRAP